MPPDDGIRLLHMIEAAESALNFVAGRQRADLDADQMLLFALVRALEVLRGGEQDYRRNPNGRQ